MSYWGEQCLTLLLRSFTSYDFRHGSMFFLWYSFPKSTRGAGRGNPYDVICYGSFNDIIHLIISPESQAGQLRLDTHDVSE